MSLEGLKMDKEETRYVWDGRGGGKRFTQIGEVDGELWTRG